MNFEIRGAGAPTRRIKNLRLVSRGDDGPRVFPGDGDGDDDRGSRDDGDGGGDNDGDGVSLLNIKKKQWSPKGESTIPTRTCKHARTPARGTPPANHAGVGAPSARSTAEPPMTTPQTSTRPRLLARIRAGSDEGLGRRASA